MSIQKDAMFTTYNDFCVALKRHEEECGVLYVTYSSKKLRKDSQLVDTLKYEHAKFVCKQGHRTRESISKGIRPNLKTFKTACPAFLRLNLVEDGAVYKLKLTTCNLEHENHPTGPEFSRLYPENRRPNITEHLVDVLNIKSASTKEVQELVARKEGKMLMTQDIKNLRNKFCNYARGEEAENVDKVLGKVQAEGGVIKYGTSESGEFKFLSFMTADMLDSLNHFPEILIMDVTYKVNKQNYPLLNILVVDSNGQGRPVFHSFLASEDSTILSSCLLFFASSYDSHRTKTIFVDKDMSEICAIKASIPFVHIRLCAFHTTTAVKKALQQKKLSSSQISCLLDLFIEQRSCTNISQYNTLKDKISEISSPDVLSYFVSNWWNCPQLWAASFLESPTFHITTTNHAETFHQKIKRVLSTKTPLSISITELLSMTKYTMQCRDASSSIHAMSLKYNTKHNSDTINSIQNDLTPFAAKLVSEQFILSQNTRYVSQCSLDWPETYILSSTTSGSSQYDCTINSCSCDFFIKFCLPCRHIFSLRSELCLPLYHCGNERFKRTAAVCPSLTSNDHHNITHEVLPARKANTPESRYHITKEITKAIESFLPLLGEQAFQSAVSHLERVLTLIKADRPVAVIDLSQGDVILPTQPETENLNAGVTASSPPPSVSSNTTNNLDVVVLPSLSPPPPSVSSNSLDVVVLPSLFPPTTSVSYNSLDVVLPSLSPPPPSVSSNSLDVVVLPSLSPPPPSVSSNSLDVVVLPSPADFLVPSSSSAAPSCGFSNVKLSPVKTKGRPRQVQSFTRQYRKRKACPQDFHTKSDEVKKQMLLSGCLLDATLLPPFSVLNLKSTENIYSVCANDNISLCSIQPLFTEDAWEKLEARIAEKKGKDLFFCNSCFIMDDSQYKMIECEGCLEWFHYHCLGLRTTSKPMKWYCDACWH